MAHNTAFHCYVSDTYLEKFLEKAPMVHQEEAETLQQTSAWKSFVEKSTGLQDLPYPPSASNEEEFRAVVEQMAKISGLEQYFRGPLGSAKPGDTRKDDWGPIRLSHHVGQPMDTWNTEAKWLKRDLDKWKELGPDFITMRVKTSNKRITGQQQGLSIRPAVPRTIMPPPDSWHPSEMSEDRFPTVDCKDPVWEFVGSFWELKRNATYRFRADTYMSCALKAAEVLRFQWSRRFIYCFLHCGIYMQLLQL